MPIWKDFCEYEMIQKNPDQNKKSIFFIMEAELKIKIMVIVLTVSGNRRLLMFFYTKFKSVFSLTNIREIALASKNFYGVLTNLKTFSVSLPHHKNSC